jgi:hypothetical protein
MTRASLRTLAAVFLLGAALAPAVALAQSANSSLTGTPLVSQSATLNNNLPQISTDGTVSAGQNNPTNVTTNASTLNGQTQSQQPAPSANAPVNNSLNKGEPTSLDSLLEWVVRIFAGIVYIAGTALNVAAYYSIVKMGDLVGQLSPLQVAWGVFRDLGNIAILFGFIAAGIMMILDVGSYGSKKMIVTLIIVAVAINFSSLAARAVIDAGNIVGIQFYKAFNNGAIPTGNISDNGISDHLMDSVKLTTLYDQSQSGAVANYPLIAFMSIILFLVVSFVFFSIAFLLVSRFVILVFLITISPLAFAGYVIPAFKKRSDEWLNTLIKNTLVAPVVLLLLLVSTKIVTSGTFTNQLANNGWTNALPNGLASTGATSIGNVIILFMIACGFYLASLIIAKNLSAFGGQMATSIGGKLTFGTLGFAGRNTVGRASHGLSQGLRKTSFARTGAGRLTMGVLDRGAKASFDARGSKAFGSLKLDAGKAPTGGYKKYEDESIKARTEYAKSLKGRSKTDEETAAEEKAKNATSAANRAAAQARSESAAAKQEFDAARAEKQSRAAALDAIRAEQRSDRYWETNPENVARLNAAQDALAASETRHAAAEQAATASAEKLAAAEQEFAARAGAEKILGEQIKYNTSDRASQEEYAENLEKGSIRSGLVFGPGAKAAAKKIKDEAKKSKNDKQLEALRKALEDAEKGGGEKKEEEKKP